MFFPIFFIISVICFLLLKIPGVTIRLSDTNIYIQMAQHILQGKLLYKDIFLTNLPFFPYLSTMYWVLVGKDPLWFYRTAALEAVLTALLIYLITSGKNLPRSIPVMAAISYLFSFIVLATSDHQTGIFFASLMATLSYFLYQREKYILSGVTLALMVATKGYFLPIAAAFIFYDFWKRRRLNWKLVAAATLTLLIILLPTLLTAPSSFIANIFGYTIFRPSGLEKGPLFSFFFLHDWLLAGMLFFCLFNFKRSPLLGLIIAFGSAFLLIFQDIYLFYINLLVPFLCIALADAIPLFMKKVGRLNGILVATLILSLALILNLRTYFQQYREIQRVKHIERIVAVIQKEKPQVLFGTPELTPILSYLTDIPLMNDVIDTNANLFIRHIYSLDQFGKDIFKQKTMVVTLGADNTVHRRDGAQERIYDPITSSTFQQLPLEKKCKIVLSQPVYADGIVNRINIWKCY